MRSLINSDKRYIRYYYFLPHPSTAAKWGCVRNHNFYENRLVAETFRSKINTSNFCSS